MILTLFLSCPAKSNAQGLIQTMLTQIAKIEIYLAEVKQGYGYVQTGLSTISQIKKGDFDLHSGFFNALMTVNPQIKSSVQVADIIAMEVQILSTCKSSISQMTSLGSFSKGEITYLTTVFSSLEDLVTKDVDELTGLLTDGNWQMSDNQRLSRIDQLYKSVEEKYSFAQSFTSDLSLGLKQRQGEENSISNLIKLYQP